MDLVSVIIPCYNRQQFIRDAIESALDQSYAAVEVIVVDDGSTDESWSIISSFGDAIRAIRIENGGASRARNHGIALARGKYLKFLDSDDLLPKDALARLAEANRDLPDNFFIVGQANSIDTDGRPLSINKYNYWTLEPGREVPRSVLLSWPTSVSMPLFPSKAVKDVGGFNEDLTVRLDYELVLRLHLAGYRLYYVAIPSAIVREHGLDRLTANLKPEVYEEAYVMFSDFVARFEAGDVAALSDEERTALARRIWGQARNAARRGYESQASPLFHLAYQIAGSKAYIGNPVLKALYRFFSPAGLEKYTTRYRALLGK